MLHQPLWRTCVEQLEKARGGMRLIALGNSAMPMLPGCWEQRVVRGQRGLHDCYLKIANGLDGLAPDDTVYLLEHDVLYPDGYFSRECGPDASFLYHQPVFRQNQHGFFPHTRGMLTSCVRSTAGQLTACFQKRLVWLRNHVRITWDEPGGMGEVAPMVLDQCPDNKPVVDIRHGHNLTGHREAETYMDSIPYWGSHAALWSKYEL
jgi:hypothetical protein